MKELISDLIVPVAGTFDTSRMGRGEPGLPTAFTWRGAVVTVAATLEAWKESSREGGRAGGELYLRRHFYRLLMGDGRVWTVYCTRQTPRSGNPMRRWFLYTVESNEVLSI